MKKVLLTVALAAMLTFGTVFSAFGQSWTFNTRVWSTNYFTTLIYDAAQATTVFLTTGSDTKESNALSAILPNSDLVFPVGIQKEGFGEHDICGPYRSAFRNPFKYVGDFAIGLDASWMPSVVGLYGGTFFKSQEVWFKDPEKNLRGFYFQPRGGLCLGGKKGTIEGGVFYDMVVGCGGSVEDINKDRLLSGLGLDFALSWNVNGHHKTMAQFSMPLHNFFNEEYTGQGGMKRRVGYIMLTHRIVL